MVTRIQRGRRGLESRWQIDERHFWWRMRASLDDDERLIFPWQYKPNRLIYDRINRVVYLVQENHPDANPDWVNDRDLKLLPSDIQILAKMLVVRVRLPWNEVNYEFLITQAELDNHRHEYDVLERYLQCRDIYTNVIATITPRIYENNRDRYQMLEVRYLVSWKWPTGPLALGEIDTILAE